MSSPHAMLSWNQPELSEQAALSFAITHITPLLGTPLEGCFYLAGGAFKSLLHGLALVPNAWHPQVPQDSPLLGHGELRGLLRLCGMAAGDGEELRGDSSGTQR